jgi:hypothetical protein
MDNSSVNQVIIRFYKEAAHEFLLSSSCHSVLFRGYVNRQLNLVPPLHGYNPTIEGVYDMLSQSLGVRLKQFIAIDESFTHWHKIHDFLNEITHCIHTTDTLCEHVNMLIHMLPELATNTKNTLELYLNSFHFILQKLHKIDSLFRDELLKDVDDNFHQFLSQNVDFF